MFQSSAKESLKKCEKCRLEPARPILPRPTPRFLHVELMASTFAAAVAREEQTRRPLAAILVSRATCPFTVGHHPCPLGHRPCPTGTPAVHHWYTGHVPLVHRPCPTGTPTVSHWYTDHVPLGHRPCTTGTPTVSHWGHPRCAALHSRRTCARASCYTIFFVCPGIAPLDKSFQRAYIVRYNVEFRKIFGVGGCRRYGRAE